MARAGLDTASRAAGAMWVSHSPRGSVSATLGGGADMLDRDLGELMGLERAHMLVEAMMAEMPGMMAAHMGIGVQQARLHRLDLRGLVDRLHLHGLADRRRRGPVRCGGKRGRGENGYCEQRCGNGLQHGCLLFVFPGDRVAGRMAGPVDRAGNPRSRALNPT